MNNDYSTAIIKFQSQFCSLFKIKRKKKIMFCRTEKKLSQNTMLPFFTESAFISCYSCENSNQKWIWADSSFCRQNQKKKKHQKPIKSLKNVCKYQKSEISGKFWEFDSRNIDTGSMYFMIPIVC